MPFNRATQNLIADFRRLPRDRSRAIERSTLPLGNLLDTLREQYRIGEPRLEEIIMREWRTIVGNERAHRCAPERILDGCRLVIYVSNATLRNEMQFDQRRILRRLQRIPGCHVITQLILRQG